jgi:hypothetical protein
VAAGDLPASGHPHSAQETDEAAIAYDHGLNHKVGEIVQSIPRNNHITSVKVRIRDRRSLILLLAAAASLDASGDPVEQTVLAALVRRLDALASRAQAGIGGRP